MKTIQEVLRHRFCDRFNMHFCDFLSDKDCVILNWINSNSLEWNKENILVKLKHELEYAIKTKSTESLQAILVWNWILDNGLEGLREPTEIIEKTTEYYENAIK